MVAMTVNGHFKNAVKVGVEKWSNAMWEFLDCQV